MRSKEKERLILKLRDSVDCQARLLKVPSAREDVRRDCAVQILNAVTVFLKSWDALKNHSKFPREIVGDAFHTLLAELGPGDAQVRSVLIDTISSLASTECRQALLDVMPCAMPVEPTELEEATQQVLVTLRQVLFEDSEALLPVLGCLSLLPLSRKGRAEAWNVALASLPVVSEADLPVLSRTLLCNATSHDDAFRALEALRTEFELLQSTDDDDDDDDPVAFIAHVLVGAFQDDANGILITNAYLEILKNLFTEVRPDDDSSQEECTAFLVLDAIAVLALYQKHDAKSEVEAVMDTWIENGAFPFSAFQLLINVMGQRQRTGGSAPVLHDGLVPSFLSLGMFLLLAPVRLGVMGDQGDSVHKFLIDLHHSLDRHYQEELVQCLLHLSEETSWGATERSGNNMMMQRVRPRKELGKLSKQDGLKLTAVAVHSLLQQLALSARSSVARFKHILVERLTSVTNDSTLNNLESTEQLCAILACLVESTIAESGSGVGIDASEVMILLQKLLFTASYSAGQRSSRGDSTVDVGRVIRGLILSTELTKSEALSRSDKECIYQWVNRILLPSTRRTVDPEIGTHGLRFLSAWSSWRKDGPGKAIASHSTDNEKLYDMFQSFKMILANTGLIQMLSLYLEGRNRNGVFLGYTKIPSPFSAFSDPSAKRKKRDMVFCVHSYLRTSNVQHPSRWNKMTKWVYDLVNTYLTMGRDGTSTGSKEKGRGKWLPDGWLEASLELPKLSLTLKRTSKKTRRSAEELSRHLCRHEISFDSNVVPKSVCVEVASSLCEDKNIDDVIEQVERVLRMTLSYLLGIGLSAAVLRNTFAHLFSLDTTDIASEVGAAREENGPRRRHELVKLMQYQAMKLYDLKRKSETSIQFLEALAATIKRLYLRANRRTNHGTVAIEPDDSDSVAQDSNVDPEATMRKASKVVLTATDACRQTQSVLSDVFCSTDFVDPKTLMTCLVDENDEAALKRGLKGFSNSVTPLQFRMIVQLRRDLLDNLCAVHVGNVSYAMNENEVSSTESVIETASAISRMLPEFRKVASRDDVGLVSACDVSGLSSSYFRLVKRILEQATKEVDRINKKASSSISLMNVFVKCAKKMEVANPSTAKKRGKFDIFVAFNSFEEHLHICEDEATALELVEILSILSLSDSTLAPRAIEACWRVLHTIYTVPRREAIDSISIDTPQVFGYAVDSVKRHDLVRRILSATIVKTASSEAKNTQDSDMLQKIVLLLWGLSARFPYTIGQHSFGYLSKLTDELEYFLDGVGGTALCSLIGDIDRHRQDDERGESRGKRSRPNVSSITCLTAATFPTLFELVLHTTLATFAISPHARIKTRANQKNPFQHHHDTVQLLSRLLDVYASCFHLFPRRMLSVVLTACKHLLSVCIYHVDGCVQWRNAQPILSVKEKRAGVHDFGSIEFLEQLLQTFATWGVGKAMIVCQDLRELLCPTAESDGDTDDEVLASLPQNDKRFTSLMITAQKTLDTLRDVASEHNLVPPEWNSASFEKVPKDHATAKRSPLAANDADKGYHELDWNEKPRAQIVAEGENGKKKRRRISPTFVTVLAGDVCINSETRAALTIDRRRKRPPVINAEGETEDYDIDVTSKCSSPKVEDDASRSSTEAFGVSGQWGGDDNVDAEEECSSGRLELEVSNIFQAA